MRKKVQSPDTREKIFLVSLDLFATRGFDRTSMRNIAEQAGIKSSSIYNHYDSKEAILKEIVELYQENIATLMDFKRIDQAIQEEKTPLEVLYTLTYRNKLKKREFLLKCFLVMDQASYIYPEAIDFEKTTRTLDFYLYTLEKLIAQGDVFPQAEFYADLIYRVVTMYLVEAKYPQEIIEKKRTPPFEQTIDLLFRSFLTEQGIAKSKEKS